MHRVSLSAEWSIPNFLCRFSVSCFTLCFLTSRIKPWRCYDKWVSLQSLRAKSQGRHKETNYKPDTSTTLIHSLHYAYVLTLYLPVSQVSACIVSMVTYFAISTRSLPSYLVSITYSCSFCACQTTYICHLPLVISFKFSKSILLFLQSHTCFCTFCTMLF